MLFSVLLELTYHCNLDCFFCYNDLNVKGSRWPNDNISTCSTSSLELQVLNLTLSGGEPLAHPSFFRIGARARELGFLVRVKSNGHALGERSRRPPATGGRPFRHRHQPARRPRADLMTGRRGCPEVSTA